MAYDLKRFYSGAPNWYSMEQRGYSQEEMDEIYRKSTRTKIAYLNELMNEGQEEDVAELINYHFTNAPLVKADMSSQQALDLFYKRFHNKQTLFHLILSVYTRDGYFFPRRLIRKAKQLAPSISEEERLKDLPEGEVVTVYRGSYTAQTNEAELKKEPSWTTSRDTAIWFAYKVSRQQRDFGKEYPPANVYCAEISRKDIIAYLTNRNESEVLQYNSVYNITALQPPAEKEVDAIFKAHAEGQKADLQELHNKYGKDKIEALQNKGLI